MPMKKNLIVFASNTGNTEKVAKEIAKNFERHGWSNDLKKLPDDYDWENRWSSVVPPSSTLNSLEMRSKTSLIPLT